MTIQNTISPEVADKIKNALTDASNKGLDVKKRVELVRNILEEETGKAVSDYKAVDVFIGMLDYGLKSPNSVVKDPILREFDRAVLGIQSQFPPNVHISYGRGAELAFDKLENTP